MIWVAMTPYTPNGLIKAKLSTTLTMAARTIAGRVRGVSLAHWYPMSKNAAMANITADTPSG